MVADWCRCCRSGELSGRAFGGVFRFRLRHGEEMGHKLEADPIRHGRHLAGHGGDVAGGLGLPWADGGNWF